MFRVAETELGKGGKVRLLSQIALQSPVASNALQTAGMSCQVGTTGGAMSASQVIFIP